MSSQLGADRDKLLALDHHATSPLFDERERLALEYADCMTFSSADVSDELFTRMQTVFDEDTLIEMTAVIAWENASSKFNRALRVESQKLWSQ